MTVLKTHKSCEKQLPVENNPIKCVRKIKGPWRGSAATTPSSLESIHLEFRCFCRRQLWSLWAWQGRAVWFSAASTGHWLLAALWMLFYPAWWLFGVYVLPVLPGVKVGALLCLLLNNDLGEKEKKRKKISNFCDKGRKGGETVFQSSPVQNISISYSAIKQA